MRQAINRSRALTTPENHLIELLSHKDRARLLAIAETVPLAISQVLCKPGDTASHVYFPFHGFVSLVSLTEHGKGVEVGMIGREGMLGSHVALGVARSPLHGLVQGEGKARRIAVSEFRNELGRNPALQKIIHGFIYMQMAQMATSAACLRFHLVGPRLARWLLMSHDRAGADSFRLTQEFLAYMLGVRRAGITVAAGALQRSGLIEYHHGDLTVLDRRGLEATACGCYAVDQEIYASLLR